MNRPRPPGRGRVVGRAPLLLGLVLVASAGLLLGPVTAASAHPLGNATVNHYDGLRLYPDRVQDRAVEDIAEIPTLQRRSLIDANGDGVVTDPERAAYATAQCAALAGADSISVNGRRLPLTVTSAEYTERPGAIQLKIGRLLCQLNAPADLSRPASVAVSDQWDGAGIGWHEITAVGSGVSLRQSPFPEASISNELVAYPNDLLSSPLDVRGGTLDVLPGAGSSTYAAARDLPVAGAAVRALSRLTTTFNDLVGARHITVGVGLLAVLLAMLLGAGHAFLPGHGKTIMAAYLVGRRGRLRDVVTVGATVTLTHTAGVLVLGLLISVTTAFAPTAAEQALGVVSGLIVAAVGAGLLVTAVRRWRTGEPAQVLVGLDELDRTVAGAAEHPHEHLPDRPHDQPHDHLHEGVDRDDSAPHPAAGTGTGTGVLIAPPRPGHDHPVGGHRHDHPAGPEHSHGGRPHAHGPGGGGFGRGGLVGLGVAGGLVPSPSALLVLLAAIALGRTVFGVVVVLAYGLGMATALSVAGLLLVRLRHHAGRLAGGRLERFTVLANALPFATASLVLVVGCWLALRAAGGTI